MSLYDLVFNEALPWPHEPKMVFLVRREAKRAVLERAKRAFPSLWAHIDRAEHQRNIRRWEQMWGHELKASPIAKEILLASMIRTEHGRRQVTRAVYGSRREPQPVDP